MNDYDFGKYYRRNNNKPISTQKSSNAVLQKFYRRISMALVAGLILFFAGLMTGIHFQSKRIITTASKADEKMSENPGIINSADINSNHAIDGSEQSLSSVLNDSREESTTESENAKQAVKKSLMDPENEYIILAKKYSESSKDRALYYAGVLNKVTKDYNFDVVPSIRGNNIKLYVGPMKGKKMAEKMLARVKSIPEFANSAILYKK